MEERTPVSYTHLADGGIHRHDERKSSFPAADAGTTAVSYTHLWDYYNDDVTTGRFRDLLKDPSTRAAWLAYAKQIYRTASAHSNFHGGFMTWEDFWNYVEDAGNLGAGANSRIAAKNCGYQAWLKRCV